MRLQSADPCERGDDFEGADVDSLTFDQLVARCDARITAARLRGDFRERLDAAAWKADRRRFTGEGPTGFGAL